MKYILLIACLFLVACDNEDSAKKGQPDATQSLPSVKLYALECGRIDMLDLSLFDKDGAYDGRTNKAADSCYLIRHPKGDLLWDTGLPDSLNTMKDGVTNGPFHVSVPHTLESQLTALGVSPADIEYLALSHSHFDHIGNAGTYAASTLLINEAEYRYMFRSDARKDQKNFAAYSALENANAIKITDRHDVFGDGTVLIIGAPGHTPGHAFLQLNLVKSGTILLTGDLYHLREARKKRTVPVFNTSFAETLKSMDKFEALATKTNARVIVQHSMKDFNSLPKPPEYID